MTAGLSAGWLGRRITYMMMCVATIGAALLFYQGTSGHGPFFLFCAFYGFFPLYFPELFPTAVRATGRGFAFSFGRIIAAVGGLQTAVLIGLFDGSFPKAGSVMTGIYLVGILLIWFGPETKGHELPH